MAVLTKLWYLQHFHLLEALTDPQKQSIDGMTQMLELERGPRICLPGDPSDVVFLLKRGVVKIRRAAPFGTRTSCAAWSGGAEPLLRPLQSRTLVREGTSAVP